MGAILLTGHFRVDDMQTVARYREDRIKTYGFDEYTDLCIVEIGSKYEKPAGNSMGMEDLSNMGICFEFVLTQFNEEQGFRLYILFKRKKEEQIRKYFRDWFHNNRKINYRIISPVDLIYFHGPHFQDRFGIANAALNSLRDEAIRPIVVACSGSAIHLVLPENNICKAKKILSEAFEVPRYVKKH